ncbi:hypothetical protein C1645_816173 [Glomus cerebriforme]|uniref:Uncharacterized protein n=1 Tax=Glomus cerebriforme TaxID=658196 RepID=A0A397TLZ3_9GLOM|nr:hypothetical protein C1645_816173 [Glomus cerebriforme]
MITTFNKRNEIKILINQLNNSYNEEITTEFPNYFKVLNECSKSDNETIAQLSRRLIHATKWFIVDSNYEVPIVLSAITSVMQYTPTPSRGIGSRPSENHVNCSM